MVDVFISYSRGNQEPVRQLADAVKRLGYESLVGRRAPAAPFLWRRDHREDRCGQGRDRGLVGGRGRPREWVRAEADVARNQKKLIQTAIDDGMPPMPFNQIQFASIGGWRRRVRPSGLAQGQDQSRRLVRAAARGSRDRARSRPVRAGRTRAGPCRPSAAPPPRLQRHRLRPPRRRSAPAPPTWREPTQLTQPVILVRAPAAELQHRVDRRDRRLPRRDPGHRRHFPVQESRAGNGRAGQCGRRGSPQ